MSFKISTQKSIVDVMSADPRSVYIRTKYGSQIFTFQLGEVAVTCKFDDINKTVTIVRIRKSDSIPSGIVDSTPEGVDEN